MEESESSSDEDGSSTESSAQSSRSRTDMYTQLFHSHVPVFCDVPIVLPTLMCMCFKAFCPTPVYVLQKPGSIETKNNDTITTLGVKYIIGSEYCLSSLVTQAFPVLA